MTGTSYNGTIPLAAAVTGVAGLEAIIPIAPNTSYYHYYRSNGLVRHPGGWLGEDIDFLYDFVNSGDPARRDYCNRTVSRWRVRCGTRSRDRRLQRLLGRRAICCRKSKNIKAAVLMAHAFNDWNVVPEHSVRIYEALKGRVPLQAYFHQGGHGGAPPLEMMNKWFTRYLYGVQNGVEKEPKRLDRSRRTRRAPPPPPEAARAHPAGVAGAAEARRRHRRRTRTIRIPAAMVTLRLAGRWRHARRAHARRTLGAGTETLVDNVESRRPRRSRRPSSLPHRLLYATPELASPVAHLRHARRHAAARLEQAGRESLGLARHPALDRRPDQSGESDHARLGRSAEPCLADDRRRL